MGVDHSASAVIGVLVPKPKDVECIEIEEWLSDEVLYGTPFDYAMPKCYYTGEGPGVAAVGILASTYGLIHTKNLPDVTFDEIKLSLSTILEPLGVWRGETFGLHAVHTIS